MSGLTIQRYQHRVNTVPALRAVPSDLGIEIDLRSDGDRVIVTHDPFTSGPTIEEFFPHIRQRPCIFNVKCEGIEPRVQAMARQCGIADYFFLDLSVPAAVKLVGVGDRCFAVRYSEYEPIEGVLAWRGLADWVWVDCFSRYPGDRADWARLAAEFRLCLVSPELQGHGTGATADMRRSLDGLPYDAVCTKRPDAWTTSKRPPDR